MCLLHPWPWPIPEEPSGLRPASRPPAAGHSQGRTSHHKGQKAPDGGVRLEGRKQTQTSLACLWLMTMSPSARRVHFKKGNCCPWRQPSRCTFFRDLPWNGLLRSPCRDLAGPSAHPILPQALLVPRLVDITCLALSHASAESRGLGEAILWSVTLTGLPAPREAGLWGSGKKDTHHPPTEPYKAPTMCQRSVDSPEGGEYQRRQE